MMQQNNRELWMWLFNEGGKYTAAEIAEHYGWHVDYAVKVIYSMHRNHLVEKFPPEKNNRRQRYGITGTCQVPQGMRLAEVQL